MTDDEHADVQATILAGITQDAEGAEPPHDVPINCPNCKSWVWLPRQGRQPYYCAVCRTAFMPPPAKLD